MFSAMLVLAGLFLLFRGAFRLGDREVPAQRSRQIAALFLVPMIVQTCVLSAVVFNSDVISPDGEIDWDRYSALAEEVASPAVLLDLFASAAALGIAAYLIYMSPQSAVKQESRPAPQSHPLDGAPIRRDPAGMRGVPPVANPNNLRPIPNVMTVAEAAAYLRVTESDIMQLIDEGKLPAARIGSSFRIARSAVDDFVQNG